MRNFIYKVQFKTYTPTNM